MTIANQPGHQPGSPDFLTVEQAARILQIGRTSAYAQARDYEVSGGAEGLPVIRVGKQLRVPRARLEHWLGGPITPPPPKRSATHRRHRGPEHRGQAVGRPVTIQVAARQRVSVVTDGCTDAGVSGR